MPRSVYLHLVSFIKEVAFVMIWPGACFPAGLGRPHQPRSNQTKGTPDTPDLLFRASLLEAVRPEARQASRLPGGEPSQGQ